MVRDGEDGRRGQALGNNPKDVAVSKDWVGGGLLEGRGRTGLLLISLPECGNLRGKIKVKELFLTILLRGALGSGRRGFSAPPAACHTIQDKHLLLFHQSALRCVGSGRPSKIPAALPPRKQKTCPSSPRGPALSSCPRDKCRGVRKESGGRKASHALLIKVGSSGEGEGARRSAAGFGGLNCFKSQYHKFMNS